MRSVARSVTALLLGVALMPSPSTAQTPADADWEITVTQPSREVIVSNKEATHFACDTGAREQRSYGGLYTAMHESLDDWVWRVDGAELDPAAAERARVWPWLLRREYSGGWAEEILLPLGEPALFVRLEGPGADWSLTPRVDMRWIWETPNPSYETVELDGAVCIRRKGWQPGPGAYAWLAVRTSTDATFVADPKKLSFQHPRDAARKAMGTTHPFEPGRLEGAWQGSALDVVFAQGHSAEEAAARAARLLPQRDRLLAAKRDHVNALLATAPDLGGDARLTKAYRWARASMDVLVMNVRGRGIYAGFHWFPNYWGRDTFICLPGACLVTGELDTARDILRSFLRFQLVDRSNPRLGRLPNIVNPGELQYAGVDGTWWYVRAAWKYVKACRDAGRPDAEYEREFAAALRLMIEGAERFAVDPHGLLKHGDGETWMDAGGEANPYSPRGNRAVEVQALYYNGLRVAEALARDRGRTEDAARYAGLADRTAKGFTKLFWLPKTRILADHLNVDDSPDMQNRPNTVLALTAVEPEFSPLLNESMVARVIDVSRKLVLPWGITSLEPTDRAFHPRHLDLAKYYYDEAYHNGDVWLWLSGPFITAFRRAGFEEEARAMLEPLVAEVLDHGAVGAIREIRDGGDTGLSEEFGGATFQAWSLAEMVRVLTE